MIYYFICIKHLLVEAEWSEKRCEEKTGPYWWLQKLSAGDQSFHYISLSKLCLKFSFKKNKSYIYIALCYS